MVTVTVWVWEEFTQDSGQACDPLPGRLPGCEEGGCGPGGVNLGAHPMLCAGSQSEMCDGINNDCDGFIDEAADGTAATVTSPMRRASVPRVQVNVRQKVISFAPRITSPHLKSATSKITTVTVKMMKTSMWAHSGLGILPRPDQRCGRLWRPQL